MHEGSDTGDPIPCEVPAYHQAIRHYLGELEPDLWNWFASQRMSAKAVEDVRFDLLKTAYRIHREDQPEIYAAADEIATVLGIKVPLTIYQAQNPQGLNASLAFLPGEVHLILHGPLRQQLSANEFRAVLSHELAHFILWDSHNGEQKIVADCLQSLQDDKHAQSTHFATLRLYQLYTEVFCDRIALRVTGDLLSVISALVKIETGVAEINPTSFLAQSNEIFARENVVTEGITHPEAYIRARALELHAQQHPDRDSLIARMIEGRPPIDEFDLLARRRLWVFTRRLISAILSYPWFQTDSALAHARMFFSDFEFPTSAIGVSDWQEARNVHESVRDYFCFVLLDFVAIERDLEELPIAAALHLSEQFEMKGRMIDLLRQEFKLRKMVIDRIDENKERLLKEGIQP